MKQIKIDDIEINWDSSKTLIDISDTILIFLYGLKKTIKKDTNSIQRRKKRLTRKLNNLCKRCGAKLTEKENINCNKCNKEEKSRYISKTIDDDILRKQFKDCNKKDKRCIHFLLCSYCDKFRYDYEAN